MTNYEKIKAMTIEEMAEHILDEFRINCADCECREDYCGCRVCIKKYLESEAVE